MQELRTLEDALEKAEQSGGPTKLKLSVKFETKKTLELVVSAQGATVRAVAIFAEQIFDEESLVVYVIVRNEVTYAKASQNSARRNTNPSEA